MSIRVEQVAKQFGTYPALHGVSLEARPGEFLALLGPSGSGKTTLLRIMAGLEFPDEGRVFFDGEDMTGVEVRDRGVGFVFQQYALFRHMTVLDNVGFGLQVRKWRDRPSRSAIRQRAKELLELVQLGSLGARYPSQLSGGQRQRVALARALAVDPRLLLLDEPFGALDAKVRKELRRWLRDLHDQMGITSVFVTHDQEEALELADRVVVMDHGVIEQVAPPQEIYDRPATAFVHSFVGESNRLEVELASGEVHYKGLRLDLPERPGFEGSGELFFRPHQVRLAETVEGNLPVTVTQVRRLGGQTRIEGRITVGDAPVELLLPESHLLEAGQNVGLRFSHVSLYPARRSAPETHRPAVAAAVRPAPHP